MSNETPEAFRIPLLFERIVNRTPLTPELIAERQMRWERDSMLLEGFMEHLDALLTEHGVTIGGDAFFTLGSAACDAP